MFYTHNTQIRLFDKNSPIKDNPRIVDKGPCTNLSFIRRFHCKGIASIVVPTLWRLDGVEYIDYNGEGLIAEMEC